MVRVYPRGVYHNARLHTHFVRPCALHSGAHLLLECSQDWRMAEMTELRTMPLMLIRITYIPNVVDRQMLSRTFA